MKHVLRVLALSLCATALWAQTPTGSIEGTITDPSSAVIASAKITVVEIATSRTVKVTTNQSGYYTVRNLVPGSYSVTIEASGFAKKVIQNVAVNSGGVANVSEQLEIGRAGEVVEVAAAAVLVDMTRQTVDSVVRGEQIKDLPLFSRNFLDLAAMAPGVFVRSGEAIDPTKTFAYRVVGINGHSGTGTRVQIDGIDVTDESVGTTTANISDEAVNEFQLTRSSLDISTSLTSSGAVNIITTTGSNTPHGSWFYDYFNQDMGARLGYQPTASAFNRKRTGGSVGFPVLKDKLFGFANWEKTWQNTQSIVNVPDFPQFVNIVQPFPTKVQYVLGRLDWNVTPSMRLFYKFNHDDNISTGGSAISPFQNVDWTNVHTIGFDIARAHATHSIRFGYTNFNNQITSQELNTKFLNVNGTPIYLTVGPLGPSPANPGATGWGPNGNAPQSTFQDNYQISYDGSYVRSKNTFRYGFAFTGVKLGGFASFAGPLSVTGVYDSPTTLSLQKAGVDIKDPTNFPLSSFSLGPQNGFFSLKGCHNLPHGCHINHRTAFFLGDNIKLLRRLSVNLGLRFEYDSGYFNNDHNVTRDPVLETWGKGFSAFPEAPKMWNPSIGFAWDPTGKGKMSIRGGFYRAYEMNVDNNLAFDEFVQLPPGIGPDTYDFSGVTGPDGTPINVDGKHPNGDYTDLAGQPIKTVLPLITQVNAALQSAYGNYKFDPHKGMPYLDIVKQDFGGIYPGKQFHAPYAIQANIGVERELKRGTVLSVDYIFNHGVGMPFLLPDFERRKDAGTLNVAAATARVNGVLAGKTVDQYIAAIPLDSAGNPKSGINAFSLSADTIFQGLTPNFLRMRFFQGGFVKYQALQVALRGRLNQPHWHALKDASYTLSYARGLSQASGAVGRAEVISNALDNHQPNSAATFGPTGLDYKHILNASGMVRVWGGLELKTLWTFRTPPAANITVPNFGSFTSSSNGIFSTDLNGDGGAGAGAPRPDVLPGVNAGQFGRDVSSLSQLNQIINSFNQNYAGKLTPAGQALVAAGLFTQAQLVKLGAVVPTIPAIPAGAPNPWHNIFTTSIRITRPIRFKERWKVSPFADIINLFNHAPMALYSGLGGTFGSLNFNSANGGYASAAPGKQVGDLALSRGRVSDNRQVQIGVRLDF